MYEIGTQTRLGLEWYCSSVLYWWVLHPAKDEELKLVLYSYKEKTLLSWCNRSNVDFYPIFSFISTCL